MPERKQESDDGKQGAILFVHSGFRTSSTWLWQKFRQADGIRAYYEPFNECLGTISSADAASFDSASWNSHHNISAPYFLEYVDLISESGGIPGYLPEMASDNYIPLDGVDGNLNASETAYFDMLIAYAQQSGRRPAFCDTRTLGRSRAIKKGFGGTHVLLTRNLHEQWCSFSEQAASGNYFFFETFFRQIEASNHDPFLQRLDLATKKRREHFDTAESYVFFLLSQLYSNALAFDVCDAKIDVTEISAHTVSRSKAEAELSRVLGSKVDLRDVRAHVSFSLLEKKSKEGAQKLALDLISEMVIPNASDECQEYIQKALDDAFTCWDQSVYYCEASKTFLSTKFISERSLASKHAARVKSLENELRDVHVAASESSKSAEAAYKDAVNAYQALSRHVAHLDEQLAAETARAGALEQQLRDVHVAASESSKSAEAAYKDAVNAYQALSRHVAHQDEQLAAVTARAGALEQQITAERNRSWIEFILCRIRGQRRS